MSAIFRREYFIVQRKQEKKKKNAKAVRLARKAGFSIQFYDDSHPFHLEIFLSLNIQLLT